MNRICNLVFILWVISDSAFCIPLWFYPDSHQYQNEEYAANPFDDVIVPKFHRSPIEANPWPSYPPERYIYDDDTPVNTQFQFSHLVPYYSPADLRSFFIPSIPTVPIPQPHPVHYAVSNEMFYSPESSTNTPSISTTLRSIGPRVTSPSISQTTQTSTELVKSDKNTNKERKEEISESRSDRSIILDSTTNDDLDVSKPTRSLVVAETSTPHIFDEITVDAKQSIMNFENFRIKFRDETTSDDKIELKTSTRQQVPEIVQSTLSILDTNPVSSSVSPSTNDPFDLRQFSIDVNDTDVTLFEESTTVAMTLQNFTESYLSSTVSSLVENVTDNGVKIDIDDVGHSTTVQPLVSSNMSLFEISLENVTDEVLKYDTKVVYDTTTVISSFETNSPILETPAENVTDDSKSLAFDTTTEITEKLIDDDVTTMISSIDTNTPDFVIRSDENQDQSTIDIITTSSSTDPSLSPELETDNLGKFTSNPNESETMKQYEQFTTFATTAPHTTSIDNLYRMIFETTSMPDATTFQLDSTFDSKHDTTIGLEESAINVPLSSNSVKANPSGYEISDDDFVTFTRDYEPNETNTEYEVITDMMPSDSNESTSNSSEIKHRYKREEFTTDPIITLFFTESIRVEVVTSSNMASDSNSKLDIDDNDRQEYIFNVTASKSHVF